YTPIKAQIQAPTCRNTFVALICGVSSPNVKVSDESQPPVTLDLSLSETAGSRSLHRLVELSRYAAKRDVSLRA
ncbi:MAG TPA: hypothetical protein VNU68_23655, partial [Verrucomicrobiae bacterium]|nr:hypothetical protein [Verrucomicrobiae bacterium]